MAVSPALDLFRQRLAAFYRTEAERVPEAAEALTAIAERLAAADPPTTAVARREKPAVRLLPVAFEAAAAGPLAGIAEAFAALEPELAWQQNPNYSDARMGAGYMENYAYTAVVGPEGPLVAEDVLVTVMVIGPGRLYPAHAHLPEEVYHLLAGESFWWRQGEDWTRRRAGALVRHRPWQPHATQTGAEPLLALASWHGRVASAADLVPAASVPPLPQW